MKGHVMVYTLPDLDYDYGALAPHIAPEIMELHHSKHHAAYVAGANTALEQLAEARANGIQGSGWAMLVWDPLGQRLNINQLFDQQANVPVGQLPVLQLDMWEHAFYLQYKNVKADYVKAWWNVVDWADVAARLEKARATSLFG